MSNLSQRPALGEPSHLGATAGAGFVELIQT
jgi:hypothetical protein